MPLNTSSNDPLYVTFRDAGLSPTMYVPALILTLIGTVGIVMNAFVVYTTIKTNTLRGSANFLMALICFFEIFHQSVHLQFLVITLTGINFINRYTSTLIAMPTIIALNANFMTVLCVAFDRLFAIVFHKTHDFVCMTYKRWYLACHLLVCLLYSAICTRLILEYAHERSDDPVTGCIADVMPYEKGAFVLRIMPTCIAILCYIAIGFIIRCNKTVAKETHTRLLRSLVIILLISIGGYLISLTFYQLLQNVNLGLQPILIWQLSFIGAIVLNISAAANGPILYINSMDYRNAFKSQLQRIVRLGQPSTLVKQIHSISVQRKIEDINGRRLSNIQFDANIIIPKSNLV